MRTLMVIYKALTSVSAPAAQIANRDKQFAKLRALSKKFCLEMVVIWYIQKCQRQGGCTSRVGGVSRGYSLEAVIFRTLPIVLLKSSTHWSEQREAHLGRTISSVSFKSFSVSS